MGNPNGNPGGSGGKKGRSGRKSARIELSKASALRKAWQKVEESVESSDVKEIALPLALKDMGNKNSFVDDKGKPIQAVLVQFMECAKPNDNSNTPGI